MKLNRSMMVARNKNPRVEAAIQLNRDRDNETFRLDKRKNENSKPFFREQNRKEVSLIWSKYQGPILKRLFLVIQIAQPELRGKLLAVS